MAATRKRMQLSKAVATFVRPAMSMHFAFTHNRPMAFAMEIVRQQREPLALELVGTGFLEYAEVLVAAGHVRKFTGAFVGQTFPRPRPYRLVQAGLARGELEIEWWTNLTMCQRFMAAAANLDEVPTRSLAGSSLLAPLVERGTARVGSARDGGQEVLISACRPDLAVVHALMADDDGNAVVTPPWGEGLSGVWAAKAVVVLAEKVVSTEEIRAHSQLVRVPAHLVDAVVEAPWGAHPYGVSPIGIADGGYEEDYEFRNDLNRSLDAGMDVAEWMAKWNLAESHEKFCQVHENRLGHLALQARTEAGGVAGAANGLEVGSEKATRREAVAVMASRRLAAKVLEEDIDTVLAGIGLSHLVAWLTQRRLAAAGHNVTLLTETGYYGYSPAAGDPYIFNFRNLFSNTMQSGFLEILGQVVPNPSRRCLAVLSTAQVDAQGNLNSTFLPDADLHLVGSGGANDIANTAFEVMAIVDGGLSKFTREAPYVTAAGSRVSTIMTSWGAFARRMPGQPYELVERLSGLEGPEDQELARLLDLTGWKEVTDSKEAVAAVPSRQELAMLRQLDPEKLFLG